MTTEDIKTVIQTRIEVYRLQLDEYNQDEPFEVWADEPIMARIKELNAIWDMLDTVGI